MKLRDYQEEAVAVISDCLAGRSAPTCIVAPTGSGKGLIEAEALRRHDDLLVTTPNGSIAAGIAQKLTGSDEVFGLGVTAQQRYCESRRIFTDGRARNLAAKGRLSWVKGLLRDECHHAINDTHDSLGDLLPVPHAGATATPYRGTPKGTSAFRKLYPGGLLPVLTLRVARDRGYVSVPEFRTLPLLDDEQIAVSGGEFVVSSVESAIASRVGQFAEILRSAYDVSSGLFRRATTVVLGSVGAVTLVREACEAAGLPTVTVVADTKDRQTAFAEAVSRRAVLLQIRAVGEGVDLPLRVMYDLSPTMSPVLWMQRVGRIMRPTDDAPTYFACCHNLMRHGYLFEGLIPRSAFVEARDVWGADFTPSRRTMTRALGDTGFGRFEPTEVRLAAGGCAFLYALKAADGLRSYAALLLPHQPAPFYFEREDALTGTTKKFVTPAGHEVSYAEKKQGDWRFVDALPELTGCASYPSETVSPWMKEKWVTGAVKRGIDASVEPTRKTWQLFRILQDVSRAIS